MTSGGIALVRRSPTEYGWAITRGAPLRLASCGY